MKTKIDQSTLGASFLYALCICAVVAAFAILLTSCSRKNYVQILDRVKQETMANNNDSIKAITPNWCATHFPPQTEVKRTIEYLPGKPYPVSGETVYVDCDSIKWIGANVKKVPCPPAMHSVDTFRITDTLLVENTARTEALKLEKSSIAVALTLKQQESNYNLEKSHSWRSRFWISTGIGLFLLLILTGIFTGKIR